ncbi:MAG: hypothetical protein K8R74_02225 [Bacteroidales bacterium]|nr:hypothetical protein [Bacteroidales bacterium]
MQEIMIFIEQQHILRYWRSQANGCPWMLTGEPRSDSAWTIPNVRIKAM